MRIKLLIIFVFLPVFLMGQGDNSEDRFFYFFHECYNLPDSVLNIAKEIDFNVFEGDGYINNLIKENNWPKDTFNEIRQVMFADSIFSKLINIYSLWLEEGYMEFSNSLSKLSTVNEVLIDAENLKKTPLFIKNFEDSVCLIINNYEGRQRKVDFSELKNVKSLEIIGEFDKSYYSFTEIKDISISCLYSDGLYDYPKKKKKRFVFPKLSRYEHLNSLYFDYVLDQEILDEIHACKQLKKVTFGYRADLELELIESLVDHPTLKTIAFSVMEVDQVDLPTLANLFGLFYKNGKEFIVYMLVSYNTDNTENQTSGYKNKSLHVIKLNFYAPPQPALQNGDRIIPMKREIRSSRTQVSREDLLNADKLVYVFDKTNILYGPDIIGFTLLANINDSIYSASSESNAFTPEQKELIKANTTNRMWIEDIKAKANDEIKNIGSISIEFTDE